MLKTKTKVRIGFVSVLSIAAGVQASAIVSQQVAADDNNTSNTTFQVNVVENLTVTLTTPQSPATGGLNSFLRNAVTLDVTSNNAKGFTASMYSKDSTDLVNGSNVISSMSGAQSRGEFSANQWGYSLGDFSKANSSDTTIGDTESGSNDGVYKAMSSDTKTPITILTSDSASSDTQNIYFGAKADATKASGTYTGTVMISVVTGDITDNEGDNPITPSNPAKDNTNTNAETGVVAVNGTNPVYDSTVTTEVSSGDTRSSYSAPAGVIEETASTINTGAPLATGLAVTAAVAAASGIFFFILAKRKKDDEDEEEDEA